MIQREDRSFFPLQHQIEQSHRKALIGQPWLMYWPWDPLWQSGEWLLTVAKLLFRAGTVAGSPSRTTGTSKGGAPQGISPGQTRNSRSPLWDYYISRSHVRKQTPRLLSESPGHNHPDLNWLQICFLISPWCPHSLTNFKWSVCCSLCIANIASDFWIQASIWIMIVDLVCTPPHSLPLVSFLSVSFLYISKKTAEERGPNSYLTKFFSIHFLLLKNNILTFPNAEYFSTEVSMCQNARV